MSFFLLLRTDRQSSEGDAEMVAVLCVEACVVDEVDAAADDVAGRECGPVRLSGAGRAERMPVVAMIAV